MNRNTIGIHSIHASGEAPDGCHSSGANPQQPYMPEHLNKCFVKHGSPQSIINAQLVKLNKDLQYGISQTPHFTPSMQFVCKCSPMCDSPIINVTRVANSHMICLANTGDAMSIMMRPAKDSLEKGILDGTSIVMILASI